MAEETQNTQQQEQNSEQSPQKSATRITTVLIALAIAVMIATPTVTFFALQSMGTASGNNGGQEQNTKPKSTQVVMSKIQTNVAGTKGRRYAQFETVLNVTNPKTAQLFRTKPGEEGESLLKSAQARINRIASQKDLQTLLQQEGRDELAKEIKRSLNELLTEEEKDGVVTKVQFSTFLVQ